MSGYTTHLSLLQRLSDGGDQTAWRDFEGRYGLLIRRTARLRGLQEVDCDEVVQDVLTSLSRAMPGFDYDPAKGMFRAYLKTVTLRAIFSRQKRRRETNLGSERLVDYPANGPSLDEIWEGEWRQYHLRRAMTTVRHEFNATDQAAFEGYVLRGEEADATAAALGVSRDQVYQAKSRIVKRLSTLIEAQVLEEG